jgi:hypothetical protein
MTPDGGSARCGLRSYQHGFAWAVGGTERLTCSLMSSSGPLRRSPSRALTEKAHNRTWCVCFRGYFDRAETVWQSHCHRSTDFAFFDLSAAQWPRRCCTCSGPLIAGRMVGAMRNGKVGDDRGGSNSAVTRRLTPSAVPPVSRRKRFIRNGPGVVAQPIT